MSNEGLSARVKDAAADNFAKVNGRTSGTGQARYRQIADSLREAIQSGVYWPGGRLPTEMELARQPGVSRVTAAAALGELARAGLVTRTPRRGTVVRPGAEYARSTVRQLIAWIQPNLEE